MKRLALIAGTCCVLLVVAFSAGAGPADFEDGSAEIDELKKEVCSLRERVEALEKATIIVSRPQPRTDEFTIRVPEALRRRRHLPKGWQERQFNGITYYVIPLNQNASHPSRLVK